VIKISVALDTYHKSLLYMLDPTAAEPADLQLEVASVNAVVAMPKRELVVSKTV
jgi:hypothetical protein